MSTLDEAIIQAAQAIQDADTLLITAGAGMGVDSGLPDFRGDQGFWNLYPAYANAKLTFADLAIPHWFYDHPKRAWGFYGYRYHLYNHTEPHAGFQLLKNWMTPKKVPGFIYTSNVDGHFQKAGFDPKALYESSGSIHYLQCLMGCNHKIWPMAPFTVKVDAETFLAQGPLPHCPDCGGLARPNIVMFNDGYCLPARMNHQRQRFEAWKKATAPLRLTIIEMGGVRYLSEHQNGTLIRINPREAHGPAGIISLCMPDLAALTASITSCKPVANQPRLTSRSTRYRKWRTDYNHAHKAY
jgi:NAD-dependent SIR2 family protein deacetylase